MIIKASVLTAHEQCELSQAPNYHLTSSVSSCTAHSSSHMIISFIGFIVINTSDAQKMEPGKTHFVGGRE